MDFVFVLHLMVCLGGDCETVTPRHAFATETQCMNSAALLAGMRRAGLTRPGDPRFGWSYDCLAMVPPRQVAAAADPE